MSNASEAFKKLKQCVQIEYYIGQQAAEAIEKACNGQQAKKIEKAAPEKAVKKDSGFGNKPVKKTQKD